ncbi:MAG: galactose ABC transporter substrate-binding protein [Clostridium butyricum]|nr:galactose ABC transporter substrate-binding protein [Clostridium butyricum]
MKILRKIIGKILIISIFMNFISMYMVSGKSTINPNKIINVSVLLYKGDDKYINKVKISLENIQEKNKDKINYKFYDGEEKQSIQNSQLEQILKEGTDLILLNIVDIDSAESVINRIKMSNIPVILFNREPISLESIKSYGKALFIGADGAEAGRIQGKIINQAWDEKGIYDKNNDNVFQYILIKGEKNNVETQLRSKYVIMSLNEYGINTLEVASEYCNWDKDYAKLVVKSLFLRYGNIIEGIICNNDEMAEGSIEALHEFGYNMGNLNNNNVIVVGIDGLDEALELIKKKEMTGTVVQNIDEMAKALYLVGNNLVQGKDPLYNTKYKFDSSGVAIRIPYSGYVVSKF